MNQDVKIAVLIPVHNGLDFTKKCLRSISQEIKDYGLADFYCVILIDDGSTDGTFVWVQNHYPDVHILEGNGDLWWSGGINKGAQYAIDTLKCSHVLLWNNDVESKKSYFKEVLENCLIHSEYEILGSKVFADKNHQIVWSYGGVFNPVTGKFKMLGYMSEDSTDYSVAREVDWLTGMGTVVPARVIREIGFWNEMDFPQYHGDTEFTYRAKTKGFKNIVLPELILWNDTTNSGLKKKDSFKDLIKMLSDRRSLHNFKVNWKFLKLYAKSPIAYFYLAKMYFYLFGGFVKNRIYSR